MWTYSDALEATSPNDPFLTPTPLSVSPDMFTHVLVMMCLALAAGLSVPCAFTDIERTKRARHTIRRFEAVLKQFSGDSSQAE